MNLLIATNRNLYNAIQSLTAFIDGIEVGGASITLYPTPRMQVSAYDQTREYEINLDNIPASMWSDAELILRLMLSVELEDRRAA